MKIYRKYFICYSVSGETVNSWDKWYVLKICEMIKSPPSGVTWYFQVVSAVSAVRRRKNFSLSRENRLI